MVKGKIIIGISILLLIFIGVLAFAPDFRSEEDVEEGERSAIESEEGIQEEEEEELFTIESFSTFYETSGIATITVLDSIERDGKTAVLISAKTGEINDLIVLETNSEGEIVCMIDAGTKICGDMPCYFTTPPANGCDVSLEDYRDPYFENV